MAELRPPPAQTGGLTGAVIPGWHLMTIAAARCWAILAVMALAAGAVWRVNGFAPSLHSLFDATGLALWATALFLEPAWAQMQAMQARYIAPASSFRPKYYALAAGVAAYSVPLALTALGALMAYDTRLPVARILTFEQLDIPVSAGAFGAVVLLLIGPSLICLSLMLLTAGRAWLGRTGGTLAWAACLLVLNSGMLTPAGGKWWQSLGLLAEMLKGRMNLVNYDPTQGMYLSDLLVEALLLPLAALVGCIALLAWSAIRPIPQRIGARLADGWTAALVALGAVCLAAMLRTGSWLASTSVPSPGNWQGLICLGASVQIIALALLRWSGPGRLSTTRANSQLAWTLCAVPAWAAYTLPNIYAGQTTQIDALSLVGVALCICALFSVLITLIDRVWSGAAAARDIAFFVLLALAVVPVDSDYGSAVTYMIREMYQAVGYAEYRQLALPMVAVIILAIVFGLWQINKRPARAN